MRYEVITLYLKIDYLSEKDAERLIREPVENDLKWDDLAVHQILKMTNGQPYLIQLICRKVIERLNEKQERNYATVDDVEAVIEKIVLQEEDHFSSWISYNFV